MLYQFDDFALDTDRRELRRNDVAVAVEPKVFDLLIHLIANRDRVVDKDELIAAVWNGRIVSESALSSALKAARGAIGDSGGKQGLIRTLPRKGVRFVGDVAQRTVAPPLDDVAVAMAVAVDRPLPEKPSVAVLPFDNLSDDPGQDYFSDGVVEEIIAALSQTPWLFVIARNSTFTYKGRAVDVRQVGRDLGVRYVLSGSVRRSARRVRVTAHLADAESRASLWASHVDGALDDVFDLQDAVARSVVGAILPKLEGAEIDRAQRKLTANLTAYDHYLRALASGHVHTQSATSEAIASCRQAYDLDPDFAAAYGLAARCYTLRKSFGWWEDEAQDIAETVRLARRAAELGRNDARALAWAGHSLTYVGRDLPAGAELLDTALTLDPNLAFAWWWRGWHHIWQGQPEPGIELIARSCRLSPIDPAMANMQAAMAHGLFFAGRQDEAKSMAMRILATKPTHHVALRVLALSAVDTHDYDRARDAMARLRVVDPGRRVSTLHRVLGPYSAERLARYEDGLRRAGLPE